MSCCSDLDWTGCDMSAQHHPQCTGSETTKAPNEEQSKVVAMQSASTPSPTPIDYERKWKNVLFYCRILGFPETEDSVVGVIGFIESLVKELAQTRIDLQTTRAEALARQAELSAFFRQQLSTIDRDSPEMQTLKTPRGYVRVHKTNESMQNSEKLNRITY